MIITTPILFGDLSSYGQDFNFSQFYSNPVYLNPALGGVSECPEVHFGYRNQWPALGKSFVNLSASAEFRIEKISGATGILINNEKSGEGGLSNLNINLFYSHRIQVLDDLYLQGAVQAGIFNRSINFSKLIFYDQIDISTGIINSQTSQNLPAASFTLPDFSTGLTLFGKKYYGGVAIHHLTTPQYSFSSDASSKFLLPMKMTIHGGATLNLQPGLSWSSKPELVISPNFMYQKQADFQQLNFGVYLTRRFLTGGLWLRHTLQNFDAMVFLIGIETDSFRFGYSYDLYIQQYTARFGGSHEISMTFKMNCTGKKNYKGTINWPVF